MREPDFISSMDDTEKRAWNSFVMVVNEFLGKKEIKNN